MYVIKACVGSGVAMVVCVGGSPVLPAVNWRRELGADSERTNSL